MIFSRAAAMVIALVIGPGLPIAVQERAPSFEVISVKPSPSKDVSISGDFEGDTFTARTISVRALIFHAYGLKYALDEIVGGPPRIDSEQYSIVAKKRPDQPPRNAMIVSVLAQRFGLRTHEELRPRPVYEAARANGPQRLGPGLRSIATDCAATRCGFRELPGAFTATGMSLGILWPTLGAVTGRRVIDKTGLTGTFDVELRWKVEEFGGRDPGGSAAPDALSSAPSLFTAVREQLGISLEAREAMLPVLVIDAVERPQPD